MTATATPSIATLDAELNQTVLAGRILDAFDRFYADDIVMQENNAPATVGKAANREREIKFVESIEQFHSAAILNTAVHGDVSFSEWLMDVTFKGGLRVKLEQVAVRKWRDDQITHERFYYNAGNA
jgi:ketosteroid isomerase-like protein